MMKLLVWGNYLLFKKTNILVGLIIPATIIIMVVGNDEIIIWGK